MGSQVIAKLLREAERAAEHNETSFRFGHAEFKIERTSNSVLHLLFANGDDTRVEIKFERGQFLARIA